jgi:PKD repeat protein
LVDFAGIIQDKKNYVLCASNVIIKMDSLGNLIWEHDCSPAFYIGDLTTIIPATGGYVVSGDGVLLMKVDTAGNAVWTVMTSASSSTGGAVQLDSDSCYYVINNSYSYRIFKVDKNGHGIWVKYLSLNHLTAPSPGQGEKYTSQIAQSPDGKSLLASITDEYGTPYWFRFDTAGNILNSRYYSGFTGVFKWAPYSKGGNTDLIITSAFDTAGAPATGSSSNISLEDILATRVDTTGTAKWCYRIGGQKNEGATTVNMAIDGGVIISGYTESFGAGGQDVYLVKTDSMGNSGCNSKAAKNKISASPAIMGTDTCDVPFGKVPYPVFNNLSLTALTMNDTRFNACTCHSPIAAFGYSTSSNQISDSSLWGEKWYWNFGDGTYDSTGVASNHNYSVIGKYNLCLTVKNSCGTDSVCHLINYNPSPIGIGNVSYDSEINISPNPSNGIFHVSFSDLVNRVEVLDITGRVIYSEVPSEGTFNIDLSSFETGIYFVKVSTYIGVIVKKVVRI